MHNGTFLSLGSIHPPVLGKAVLNTCLIVLMVLSSCAATANGYKATRRLEKSELPKITAEDILTGKGTIPSKGHFELLRWQSPIPPYYSYVANCVVKEAEKVVPKENCLRETEGYEGLC